VLLWVGPFALLALAIWAHRRIVKGRNATPAQLSDEERSRLQGLLGGDPGSGRR
jgi:cytochrome c-type biogenesis protein CcmH/NrfF